MGGKHIKVLALLVTVLALAIASPAYAGSASTTYNGDGGEVEGLVAGGGNQGSNPSGGKARAASSGLPFTGLDLGLMLGGGILLIGTGAGLTRVLSRRSPA